MGDPMTPEARFAKQRNRPSVHSSPQPTVEMLDALRAMIASLDAEIARQSVTINHLERRLDEVVGIVRLIGDGAE
jgi:hypothetical protein